METTHVLLIITALWLFIATHLAEREVIRDRHSGWEAVVRALLWPLRAIAATNNYLEAQLQAVKRRRIEQRNTPNENQ